MTPHDKFQLWIAGIQLVMLLILVCVVLHVRNDRFK